MMPKRDATPMRPVLNMDGDSDDDDDGDRDSDFVGTPLNGLDRMCSTAVCARSHLQFIGSIVTSGVLATGIVMIFVGMIVYPNGGWCGFVFIGFSVATFCHVWFRKGRKQDQFYKARESSIRSYEKAIRDAAYVLLGFAATTSLVIPIFLAHNSFITMPTLILTVVGTLMVYGSGVMYIGLFEKPLKDVEDDSDEDEDEDELERVEVDFAVFDVRTAGCLMAGAVFAIAWWVEIDGIVFGKEYHKISEFKWYYVLPGVFSSLAFVMLNIIRLERLISFGAIIPTENPTPRQLSRAMFLRGYSFGWFGVLFACICFSIWIMVAEYPGTWSGWSIVVQSVIMLGATCLLLYARLPLNMPTGNDDDDDYHNAPL